MWDYLKQGSVFAVRTRGSVAPRGSYGTPILFRKVRGLGRLSAVPTISHLPWNATRSETRWGNSYNESMEYRTRTATVAGVGRGKTGRGKMERGKMGQGKMGRGKMERGKIWFEARWVGARWDGVRWNRARWDGARWDGTERVLDRSLHKLETVQQTGDKQSRASWRRDDSDDGAASWQGSESPRVWKSCLGHMTQRQTKRPHRFVNLALLAKLLRRVMYLSREF